MCAFQVLKVPNAIFSCSASLAGLSELRDFTSYGYVIYVLCTLFTMIQLNRIAHNVCDFSINVSSPTMALTGLGNYFVCSQRYTSFLFAILFLLKNPILSPKKHSIPSESTLLLGILPLKIKKQTRFFFYVCVASK